MTDSLAFPQILGEPFPLLAFSYSSKGFPDLTRRFNATFHQVPSAYLVSLYDYHYFLEHTDLISNQDQRIRIWDSGGYETGSQEDISSVNTGIIGDRPWSRDLYMETAQRIPWSGNDIVVSFDGSGTPSEIPFQVELALDTFVRIPGKYKKDILVHFPALPDVHEFAQVVAQFHQHIDIIGVTEKEIAPTWVEGVRFITSFYSNLRELGIERLIPLHVFGCFDPKTITLLSFAGAHIFDGLTWMRYYFADDTTFYRREFEYRVDPAILQDGGIEEAIAGSNIAELTRLRAALVHCLYANDTGCFEAEKAMLDNALGL